MPKETIALNKEQRSMCEYKKLVAEAAAQDFASYARGLMDGLKLNGEYGLDTNQWAFVKRPKKEDKDAS